MEREICLNKDGKTQIEFLVLRRSIEQEYTRYRTTLFLPLNPTNKNDWFCLACEL
jgi:hypothetical protein